MKKSILTNSYCYNKEFGKLQHLKMLILGILIVVSSSLAFGQESIAIHGTITDLDNQALAGVTIAIKDSPTSTMTNQSGHYELNAYVGDILIFSHLSYETQTKTVNSNPLTNIQLSPAYTSIQEVVVVGYGTQKRESVTGSISSVKGSQLAIAPIASVSNTLAGRLPGLISQQPSGQPGFDAARLSIRGYGSALIIVDGVQADFNSINQNEIESVSILKDGAASIYGSRAGNGVILVTTKRGLLNKPTITLNSSFTQQGITSMVKPVNAGQFSELTSEAYLQAGLPIANVPYTEEEIARFYAGDNPQYPNTNWYDVLIRDWAPQSNHDISVRGGSEQIKYYGFLGYIDQESIWKKSGGNSNRYNLLSNIDAKVSDNFSLQLDLGSTVKTSIFPPRLLSVGGGGTSSWAWEDYWATMPTYPATLPDPTKNSYAGSGIGGAHLSTDMDIAGYTKVATQNLKGTMALNYSSTAIEGLSAKALVNYLQDYDRRSTFSKPFEFYTYDYGSEDYLLKGSLGSNASLDIWDYKNKVLTGQFSLNYDKTIANDHNLKVFGLYEVIDYRTDALSARRGDFMTDAIDQLYAGSANDMSNNGSATEMGRKSYAARLNYSYKDKYLLESSIRADASAKFPPGKRWGYFPSVSLGWQIAEENFMKSATILDQLKLRASYGSAGDDGVGNFQYLSGYELAKAYALGYSYLFGEGGVTPAMISKGLANYSLTWERIKIYNAAIDFSIWNRKLYGTADVFYRERNGIPTSAMITLPSTFGSELAPENLNSLNNRGFELLLGTSGTVSDLSWDISGNISWSRSKWGHFEEPEYTDPDQKRINQKSGQWTDLVYSYLSDGLFTSMEEIALLPFNQDGNLTNPNSSIRPGDVKYKDVNGDGMLDWKDQVVIGKGTTPHWMFGFNTNLKYKDFDFSALFQGAFGYHMDLALANTQFTNTVFDERWTPENNRADALIPRLGGIGVAGRMSDYRYKKAGYLRLKTLSIGYSLPIKWIERAKFSQLRIYTAGINLLTFDKLKKYGVDPEAPSGSISQGYYYPQQRTISFGLTASF